MKVQKQLVMLGGVGGDQRNYMKHKTDADIFVKGL